jgi:hypothetical protein
MTDKLFFWEKRITVGNELFFSLNMIVKTVINRYSVILKNKREISKPSIPARCYGCKNTDAYLSHNQ